MPIEASAWTAIGLIAAVTAATRLAGPLMMRFVTITPAIERFLEAMSVSVIAAIVVSAVARDCLRGAAVALVAAIVMLVFRNTSLAMIAGIATAAGWSLVRG
jgi:uncharacterized membrane protein